MLTIKTFLEKYPKLKTAAQVALFSAMLSGTLTGCKDHQSDDVHAALATSINDTEDYRVAADYTDDHGKYWMVVEHTITQPSTMDDLIADFNKIKDEKIHHIWSRNFVDIEWYANDGVDLNNLKKGDVVYMRVRLKTDLSVSYMKRNKALEERPLEESYRYKNQWELFNTSDFDKKLPRQVLAPWVRVIRDKWLTFYIVQSWDNLSSIRQKLSRIPEFSYLSDDMYAPWIKSGRNIKGFNVPSSSLVPWFYLPIPLSDEQRIVGIKESYHWALEGIDAMKEHPIYGDDMVDILEVITKEDLATLIVSFARSETAERWSDMSDPIGSVGYQRWEPDVKPKPAFSFSAYHILMEKNADGKTYGPWLKARTSLRFTEGQVNHPRNGAMLLLAFFIEKKRSSKSWNEYFPLKPNTTQERTLTRFYNGTSDYNGNPWKLGKNYAFVKDFLAKYQ